MPSIAMMWQRLDAPGHEVATLRPLEGGWLLEGTVLVANEERPCRLVYVIRCDFEWRTSRVEVHGEIGNASVRLELTRSTDSEWNANGQHMRNVAGCLDIDLGFTPATNLLPIRRLRLGVGDQAGVRAAWVRFPELTLEPLDQVYTRLSTERYLYESAGGAFRRELTVDEHGFVLEYPKLWRAVCHSAEQTTALLGK
ncbi:MAG TPA: putative glycolipid-binding domain-containing protein [Gemmatimonadaceae bacterium]|nr:putative glycolipid-binding domain-containing protein [Gemmatimonadaceae bacterium]